MAERAAEGRAAPSDAGHGRSAASDVDRKLREAEDRLSRLFEPGGGLAGAFEAAFEARAGQHDMAMHIWRTLKGGGPVVVEAGTGTGKSLAYLAPAALWSEATGERVAVSTQTLHLQEQLLTKDIPLLERALGAPVEATVQRGWQNYVCRLRAERVAARPHEWLEPGEAPQMAALLDWMRTTATGVRSDVPHALSANVWDKVVAETDACSRAACPHYDDCFFFRARRQALQARLLLVNHHLYFADVAVRRQVGFDTDVAVLPKYATVIFDEAHHIEHVATEYFGASVSRQAAIRLAHRVYRPKHGGRAADKASGLAPVLTAELSGASSRRDSESFRGAEEAVRTAIESGLIPAAQTVAELGAAFFDRVAELTRRWGTAGEDGSAKLRLPLETWNAGATASGETPFAFWEEAVLPASELFCRQLLALANAADGVASALAEHSEVIYDKAPDTVGSGWRTELTAVSGRARGMALTVRTLLDAAAGDRVYWLESKTRPRLSVSLHEAPIDVGTPFCRNVVEQLHAVGMVSATLAVAGSFAPFLERMGLRSDPTKQWSMALETHEIPSPFHYRDQAWIGVPAPFPEPDAPGYADALESLLETLLPANPGGAFVLFTARRMMQRVYERLAPRLKERGLHGFMQGEVGRTALLEQFRSRAGGVLFGTDSFWEGVDVPGEALSLVVVTRLPFRVPTDPVMAARAARLSDEGRDPFTEYVLPQAVLKLRQGFGRLIRTQFDTGAVIITDVRLTRRGYGNLFLASLPDCEVVAGTADELAARLQRFR